MKSWNRKFTFDNSPIHNSEFPNNSYSESGGCNACLKTVPLFSLGPHRRQFKIRARVLVGPRFGISSLYIYYYNLFVCDRARWRARPGAFWSLTLAGRGPGAPGAFSPLRARSLKRRHLHEFCLLNGVPWCPSPSAKSVRFEFSDFGNCSIVAVELMPDIIELSQKILVSLQKRGVGVKVVKLAWSRAWNCFIMTLTPGCSSLISSWGLGAGFGGIVNIIWRPRRPGRKMRRCSPLGSQPVLKDGSQDMIAWKCCTKWRR
jgi:hypothetical protein